MSKTNLLPPIVAVQNVWARSCEFSSNEYFRNMDNLTLSILENIKNCSKKSQKEKAYIDRVIIAMDAGLRSLHALYQGRQLNFNDNDKLRDASLEELKESKEFGNQLKDHLKSLPLGIFLAPVTGILVEYIQVDLSNLVKFSSILLSIVVGYFINFQILKIYSKKKKIYVKHDFNRSIYYHAYLKRVEKLLTFLYKYINSIHKEIFGQAYPEKNWEDIIQNMVAELKPKFCKNFQTTCSDKQIISEIWPFCETGVITDFEKMCEIYQKEKRDFKNKS